MKKLLLKLEKKILIVIALIATSLGFGQTSPITYTTPTTSGTFSVPAGVTEINVQTWGSGGAGSSLSINRGGGGGGAGAYAQSLLTVVPGTTYNITVGTGGVSGTNGTDSSFGASLVVAKGGLSASSNNNNGALGGAASPSSIGDVTTAGGNGANGINGSYGGGGGASPGTLLPGVDATNATGAVANAGGGNGANGRSGSQGNGSSATGNGGGGGGAYRTSSGSRTAGNGANGQVTISWVCPIFGLTSPTTVSQITCGSSAALVTVRSSTMITGSYTITYNLTGATNATGNTAIVSFTAGSPGIASFNSSILNPGITTITITNIALGTSCNNAVSGANYTANVNLYSFPSGTAGSAITTCSTSGAVNITTGASAANYASLTWTSSGTGTFVNPNSLTTCSYNPSPADITAGSITLTMTIYGISPCGNVTYTKTVSILPIATSVAGTTITTCSSSAVNITAGSSATNTTGVTWTSSGTGTFTNSNSLTTCTYSPSPADITAGSVTLTLTATGNTPCGNVASTKTITITANNTVTLSSAAGTNAQTTCVNTVLTNITYATTEATGATFSGLPAGVTGNWVANVVTISGTPTALGIFNYTITLTGGCGPLTTGSGTITVTPVPTITGATPGSRTGAGTVNLGATASAGTINWYAAASGGASLGTGTAFTTPVISITTTYYVDATNNGCTTGTRTAVVATVNFNEIDIQGNATSIVDGDSTPTTADWTNFSTVVTTRTFTIRNTGTALLTVGTITFSGTNASEFSVTTLPSAIVAVGSSTTFTVTFSPIGLGVRTATISIVNNDTDENPYDFAIQGTGIEQEIDIQGNATSIADGDVTPTTADWTDFSTVAGTRTFTIRNTGNIALTIGTITIGGANAADFTVTIPPAATISANGTTTFVVTFSPSAINLRTATISIVNNDTSENTYDFAIQGFGIIPEIDIQGNTTSIVNGDITPITADWTDFSSTAGTRTFTIFNNGNIALTVGAITFTGLNASEFTVTTPPSATVAALNSTTFVVTFLPTAVGIRTATINIVTNDSNENPYLFNIQGTGTTREIDLQGNGLSISSGDMVTSVSDGSDFGPADINLATVTRTFTILNTGSLSLTIANPTITGLNAAEFSVTANPGTLILGAGTSTTFQITFNPSVVFTRVAQINIVSNDSDENPYIFAIQGTGVLDNDGDGIDNNSDQDDDNDGIIDTIECGSCISDPFINGSFETPPIPAASYAILPTGSVTGWQTSAEPFIEIWSSGFSSGSGGPVPAAAGNQFAELNANVPGILYQTFCLNGGGGTINWTIKHRGRSGTDTAYVKFGDNLANAIASSPIVTMVDGNTSWGSYSGTYSIPVGQTTIVLTFQAGPTASGSSSVGNFIDDVQIIINQYCIDSDADGIADLLDVDDENDGISDIEEAGFKGYSNGKSTMDKTNAATWADTNSNGINDYIDALITAGTYSLPDTDGDGVPNYLDMDSDNDSLFDVDESGLLNGDGDITGDGKGDGLDTEGDGLLNLYDNSANFGSVARAYAQDSDSNGIPDYLQLDSNDDGINDIQTGLYASYDANNDGIIDGTGDSDGDGILNIFDTNDIIKGSPRDLNRKLFLDFDGRNDYAEGTGVLGGLANASIMAWINLRSGYNAYGIVVGQNKFQIRVTNLKRVSVILNSTTVVYNTPLNEAQWYHVGATYDGATLRLFVNGSEVASSILTGAIAADATLLTIGRNPTGGTFYFNGKIDEVRIFNVALTNTQFQRMVYQEIQNTGSQVRGAIIPKDIGSLPFTNVLRYYRMDAYKDDIIDDLTTPAIDSGTGMKIYNHKFIKVQEAPMPFVTLRTGTFAVAVDDPTKEIKGTDLTDVNNTSSIVQVKHNIIEPSNMTSLGMIVDPGITVSINGDNKIQNDWYLKLDGKIDLVGKSQLVQTLNSELDVTSAGSLERDQQGQTNKFNYNYWSSPVSEINTTSNNTNYTVAGVMKDGTNPNSIQNYLWTSSNNSIATSPITMSSRWIYKFQNVSGVYANWTAVGQNGALLAGQGYTLKGSSAVTESQNHTFVGKPNSGLITSPIAANNLNLSGNPYPSAIDVNAFIAANAASTTGTVYFWEHYNTNTSHNLIEYQGGYATRNLIGGVAPITPAGISGSGSSTKVPGRYIPVGQGFFVAGSATGGLITFNNDQRLFIKEEHVDSNTLFRNQSVMLPNQEDAIPGENTFPKLRLGLTSINNYHRQILLGFMGTYATSGLDKGYDAVHLDTQPNDMYFMNHGTKLIIQGDGTFNSNKIYPISVKTSAAGNVKFMVDSKENFDDNQNIYIYDSLTDTYHNIKTGMFQIVLPQGTIDNRFSLRFTGAPPSVALDQCGVTLQSLGTLIASTSIAGITGYKFRVTNQRTAFTQELTRTLHWFSLTMLSQYNYGDTYNVEVAVKTTGAYSGYSETCTVTAPEVPSLSSQCGTTITSTFVTTNSLDRVTSYRFEVTNLSTNAIVVIDNNLNWFRLNMLSNYSASTNFNVRVALFTTGVWSSFGTSCTITSPGIARTTANNSENETVVYNVSVSPNPFSNHFSMFLNSTNTQDVSIKVYDMIGKLMEQRIVNANEVVIQEIGNSYPTGVYIVVVSQGEDVKTIKITKR